MRLDTACFVAPKPKVPSMPTRRAFLLAGSTFVFGGACGYALGSAGAPAAGAPEGTGLPLASGNAELDELQRLAVQAPIEELVAQHLAFMELLMDKYRDDAHLWHGVDRMVNHVFNTPALAQRHIVAQLLAQSIEMAPPARRAPFLERLKGLRQIR
jgi:hypothetical protein